MTDRTQILIGEAQVGTKQAAEELLSRYSPRVLAIARARLGPKLRSKLESVDVAQSVLCDAFAGLDNFHGDNDRALVAWLSRIVENKIRDKADYFGAAKREPPGRVVSASEPVGESGTVLADLVEASFATTPSENLQLSEELVRLEEALAGLPTDYREAVLLSKYEGLSFPEIGRRLGRSPDACRMLLTRAMVRLTEAFMDLNDGPR